MSLFVICCVPFCRTASDLGLFCTNVHAISRITIRNSYLIYLFISTYKHFILIPLKSAHEPIWDLRGEREPCQRWNARDQGHPRSV